MLSKLEHDDGTADNLAVSAFGRKVNATIDAFNRLGVEHIVQLTQADYDALSPPDPATLYVIVG
jgi:hypothetical protein